MNAKMDLRESAQSATMHGFGRLLLTKNKLLRFIWILILLCSAFILISQVEIIAVKFTSRPTVIKLSTNVVPKIPFPALTICGLNDKNGLLLNGSEFPKNEDMTRLSKLNSSCLFGGRKRCSYPKDFKEILTIDRGLCTTFNPDGAKKQNKGGYYDGLNLILFLNRSKPSSNNSFSEDLAVSDVVEVIPHHHEYFPFTLSNSYLVSPGYLTRIEMKKEVTKRLPYPYKSNCSDGEEIDLIYPGKYTLTNCQESCTAKEVSKTCRHNEPHRNHYLPKRLQMPIAKKPEDLECMLQTYDKMNNIGHKFCHCNLPCREERFPSTVSYSQWPSPASTLSMKGKIASALDVDESTITHDYMRQNFAKISVFYGDVSYTEIEEIPSFTLDQLISDVGGQMGIWIGASVFSILELFYLGMQALHYAYAKRSIHASPQPNI